MPNSSSSKTLPSWYKARCQLIVHVTEMSLQDVVNQETTRGYGAIAPDKLNSFFCQSQAIQLFNVLIQSGMGLSKTGR